MITTHTRLDEEDLALLDYLCGRTGERRPQTLKRIIRFAIRKAQEFMQQKKYLEVIETFGEPTLRRVTK
jgi:predicted nucleotidyltransferase